MAFYYKHHSPQYNSETGKFTIQCELKKSVDDGSGATVYVPGFESSTLEVTVMSVSGLKDTCAAFMSRVQTMLSDEVASSASIGRLYKTDGSEYTPPT